MEGVVADESAEGKCRIRVDWAATGENLLWTEMRRDTQRAETIIKNRLDDYGVAFDIIID